MTEGEGPMTWEEALGLHLLPWLFMKKGAAAAGTRGPSRHLTGPMSILRSRLDPCCISGVLG